VFENLSGYDAAPPHQHRFSEDIPAGLLQHTTRMLQDIAVNPEIGTRLGIRSSAIEPKALAELPPVFRDT